jgi:hypothetical protein
MNRQTAVSAAPLPSYRQAIPNKHLEINIFMVQGYSMTNLTASRDPSKRVKKAASG